MQVLQFWSLVQKQRITVTWCEIYFYSIIAIIDFQYPYPYPLSKMTLVLLKETATEYWLCVFHSKSTFKPICFIAMNNSFDHAEQVKTWGKQNIFHFFFRNQNKIFRKCFIKCVNEKKHFMLINWNKFMLKDM